MKKLKVFLDTSIIVSHFQDRKDVSWLFSKEVLEKVQYVINSIVYQETILVMDQLGARSLVDFEKLDKFVTVVQIDKSKTDVYLEKLRKFRNLLVHANEFLILQTAILECDYLLTLDNHFLQIGKVNSLRIVSPTQFFEMLGAYQ